MTDENKSTVTLYTCMPLSFADEEMIKTVEDWAQQNGPWHKHPSALRSDDECKVVSMTITITDKTVSDYRSEQ